MPFIITVTYDNQDDETQDEFYGPFRSLEKAEKERDRIIAALGENHIQSEDLNRSVYVYVRRVEPVRTRAIRRNVKDFLGDDDL